MLKAYFCRVEPKENTVKGLACEPMTELTTEHASLLTYTLPTDTEDDGLNVPMEVLKGGCFENSEVLSLLSSQLSYLTIEQRGDIMKLIASFLSLFNDVPPGTNIIQHDIEVGSALPLKQHAYRCPIGKREAMK